MKIMFVDGFVETAHIGVAFGCYQLPIQRKAFKALWSKVEKTEERKSVKGIYEQFFLVSQGKKFLLKLKDKVYLNLVITQWLDAVIHSVL